MNSEDIIAKAVKQFWEDGVVEDDCVVFFEQKYHHEKVWEKITCVVYSCDSRMVFEYDFCEGQSDVRSVKIIKLSDVIDFFEENGGLEKYERIHL